MHDRPREFKNLKFIFYRNQFLSDFVLESLTIASFTSNNDMTGSQMYRLVRQMCFT